MVDAKERVSLLFVARNKLSASMKVMGRDLKGFTDKAKREFKGLTGGPLAKFGAAIIGLQAGFDQGRFGDFLGSTPEVLSFGIDPSYAIAVEVIESSWGWLLLLLLLIAAAVVSGLDRRRLKRARHTAV